MSLSPFQVRTKARSAVLLTVSHFTRQQLLFVRVLNSLVENYTSLQMEKTIVRVQIYSFLSPSPSSLFILLEDRKIKGSFGSGRMMFQYKLRQNPLNDVRYQKAHTSNQCSQPQPNEKISCEWEEQMPG